MKCYLLDLENLPYAMKWAYHQEYSKEDRVYVLYSEELYSYYLQNIASMNKKCKFVKGFKITSKSKNALDFNLAGIFVYVDLRVCTTKGRYFGSTYSK